jgi:tight adherence protein C
MPMLLVLAIACFAAAVYLVGEFATAPTRLRRAAINRASSYGRVVLHRGGDTRPFRERVVGPAANRIAHLVLRLSPKTSVEAVTLKLIAAGLTVSPTAFLAAKGVGGAGGLGVGLLLGGSSRGPLGAFFFGILLAGAGWKLPELAVTSRARSRREQIRSDLPDALDLLAVSVEAGLGFDGALTKITEHMDGPLSEEFGLALGEIRVGEGRAEALKKMAARTGAPEVAGFTRSIIQADQLGISLGRILRVQAADTRLRRQAAAEERAMKAPVKMLFPTVLFIFPAMFIVILGPAMLNFLSVFK